MTPHQLWCPRKKQVGHLIVAETPKRFGLSIQVHSSVNQSFVSPPLGVKHGLYLGWQELPRGATDELLMSNLYYTTSSMHGNDSWWHCLNLNSVVHSCCFGWISGDEFVIHIMNPFLARQCFLVVVELKCHRLTNQVEFFRWHLLLPIDWLNGAQVSTSNMR